MNTKSLLTRIGVPVLSLGLLGGIGATLAASAAPASAATLASSTSWKAVTHISNAEDTTSGVTSVTDPIYGPVWAYDNLSKQFDVTETAPGHYTVVETVHGSFTAFDEPNSTSSVPVPINVTGSVDGTNTYYELSPVAPDPAAVPSQETSTTHSGTILDQLFGSQETPDNSVIGYDGNPATGNLWVFTYKAHGETMTQAYNVPASLWGNITG